MRVSQQEQCYAAEAVLGSGVSFADVAAAQAWVDALRDEGWWHLQGFSLAVLRIEVGRSRAHAGVGWYEPEKNAGRIELGPGQLNTSTILHEVAHVLAMAQHGSKTHDPAWARTYLVLVSCVLGAAEYTRLRDSFDAHGVNYTVAPVRPNAFAL